MSKSCHRICLTPTRNEAWVIKQFLGAANCWASHIVVADQDSSDGTRQQLQDAIKVQIVHNHAGNYDEGHRQRLLIDRARQVAGKRILIALDADEALSANCLQSEEWERIADAEPGTVLRFRWVNILPGFQEAWIPPGHVPLGFVDDGAGHQATRIHSRRLPWPDGAAVIDLDQIVVLHFQYVAWERMISKHRWYQAWEHLHHGEKGPLQIFREYNHMYGSWGRSEIHPVRAEWLEGYERAGIDFRSLRSEPVTWWDREIVEMLREHGPEQFRRIGIWDKDWNATTAMIGRNEINLSDPRSIWERTAHCLLKATQRNRENFGVRALERILRLAGW